MKEQQWLRVDELFAAALEIPDDERTTFLKQACAGKPKLLAEVLELLSLDAQAEAESFLEHRPELSRESQQVIHDAGTVPGDLLTHPTSPFETIGIEIGHESLTSWDRFEVVEVLGEGGMGRVFKARDLRLNRLVAIKVLHRINPQLARRLAREAKTQARIDNENVCKVYEIGELKNVPYIAMQYIDGETLEQAAAQLTPEQKIVIMGKVAAAVHAAHQQSVVHRDLKPSNVMIEEAEDGSLKPYVLDFGLARETEGATLTAAGEILGTPGFMAPEQIEGGIACTDRRTDVFSLGATLYSILAGRHPFTGATTPAVLLSTIRTDVVPLREVLPEVPADLEAIVMKCLERQQEHRYSSARAFAEDLRRYLEGEPVAARPSGLWRRMLLKARRNRRGVAVAATIAIALLIFGSLWLHTRWSARKQANLALRFGQEIERIEGVLWKARSLELHDMRPTNEMALSRLAELEEEIEEFGSVASGPGHTALGRGFLALDDLDMARSHLETAWTAGFRSSETAYALGLTLSQQYRRKLKELAIHGSGKGRIGSEYDKAVQQYREPAREYLARVSPLAFDSPAYVEALLAASEGELEQSLQLAAQAVEQRQWLYEAIILEGEVLGERAFRELQSGAYGDALETYKAALLAFERALEIGRSDIRAYSGACSAAVRSQHLRVWRLGNASEDDLQNTIKVCEDGLTAAPDSVALRRHIARAHLNWAEQSLHRGEDPSESLAHARDRAKELLDSNANQVAALRLLATILWHQGKYQIVQGEDPTSTFSEAIDHATLALAADEGDMASLSTLGMIYLEKGAHDSMNGVASIQTLSRAIDLFERATSMAPSQAEGPINAGIAYIALGSALAAEENEISEKLEAALAKARENLQTGLALEPGNADACQHLGSTYAMEARIALATGADPRPAFSKAIELFSSAIATKKNDTRSYLLIASTYQDRAQFELELGIAPNNDLEKAGEALEKAESLFPGLVEQTGLSLRQAQLEDAVRALLQH